MDTKQTYTEDSKKTTTKTSTPKTTNVSMGGKTVSVKTNTVEVSKPKTSTTKTTNYSSNNNPRSTYTPTVNKPATTNYQTQRQTQQSTGTAPRANVTSSGSNVLKNIGNTLSKYLTTEGVNSLPDDSGYKKLSQQFDKNTGGSFITTDSMAVQKGKEADNRISTEKLLSGQESKGTSLSSAIESSIFGGVKLSQEEIDQFGGVVVDKNTGSKADMNYVSALSEKVNGDGERLTTAFDTLNDDYKNGRISSDEYVARYEVLKKEWDGLVKNSEKLNSYDYLTGKRYYDWLKQNGTDQEVKDFEAYVASYDDSYMESLANSYKQTLTDWLTSKIEPIEMISALVSGDESYLTSDERISTRLREVSQELQSYTLNGRNDQGFRRYSLQTISSLMPMVNDAVIATITGGAIGLEGGALNTFVSAYTNVQMGMFSAGETMRQRLTEGNRVDTSFINGVTHGAITGMVEAFNVGGVTNIIGLLTGTVGQGILGVGLLSLPRFATMAMNTVQDGAGEMVEEWAEVLADYYADRIQNALLGNITGDKVKVGNSPWDPETYGGVGDGGLTDQMIMAGAGAVLMGVPTNVAITMDSLAKYKAGGEAIKFYEAQKQYAQSINDNESVAKADAIIEFLNQERQTYLDRSTTKGAVETAEDQVAPAPSIDEILNVTANAFKLDVDDQINNYNQLKQSAENMSAELQNSLAQRGFRGADGNTLSIDKYASWTPEQRTNAKQVVEYANSLNTNVGFDDTIDGDGYFNPKTGQVVINPNSQLGQVSTMIHEYTHLNESSKYYDDLKKVVEEIYDGDIKSAEKVIAREYKKRGVDVSKGDLANREFVAIVTQSEIGNEEFVKKLIKYNSSLAYRMFKNIQAMATSDVKTQLENTFMQAFKNVQTNGEMSLTLQQSLGMASEMLQINQNYEEAVNKGDLETAQKLVDKVAKENGYDIKAYHGTNAKFTQFSNQRSGKNFNNYLRYGTGFYFAPTAEETKKYGKNTMSVYLSADRLLDASKPVENEKAYQYLIDNGYHPGDAKFAMNYGDRFVDTLYDILLKDYSQGGANAQVQSLLREFGYDGVVAFYGANNDKGEVVVFDPSQIKSADPVTYDENGKIIPLDERFNRESDDIRYSKGMTPEQLKISQDYNEAVNNNDMEVAQELVRDYAVTQGFSPEQFYHATASEGFTEFDKSKIKADETDADYNGFWVTTNPDTSPSFRDPKKTYSLYIKYGNIAPANVIKDVQKELRKDWYNPEQKLHDEARSFQDEVRLRLEDMGYNSIVFDDKVDINTKELEETGATEWTSARGTKYRLEYDEERSQEIGEKAYLLYRWSENQGAWMWTQEDYWGTPQEIANEINTYRHGEKVVVLFEPNQIKSSAPVEYDDNGNVIPLEERFNQNTNDLRYSKGMTTEDLEGDYGYHYGAENIDYNKKSERLYTRSGRRSGAFGTGTYFFGKEGAERAKGYHFTDGKTEHKVDFSDYNLFKPANARDGETLHEIFKKLDNNYKHKGPKTTREYWDEMRKIRDSIEQYEHLTSEQAEDLKARLMELGEEEDVVDYILWNNSDDQGVKPLYLDSDLRDLSNGKYYDSNHPNREYAYDRIKEYEDTKRNIWRLALILNEDEDNLRSIVNKAMRSAEADTHKADFSGGNYDSVGTRIMKALGYEGIDVRGIKELDDSFYGSVIYDLKPSSVQYSKGMTAKMLSQNAEYEKAVAKGDIEKVKKLVDQVAKENGYSTKVFHGTPYGGFTVFDRNGEGFSWFTENSGYASIYANGEIDSSEIFEGYLRDGKYLDVGNIEGDITTEGGEWSTNSKNTDDWEYKLKGEFTNEFKKLASLVGMSPEELWGELIKDPYFDKSGGEIFSATRTKAFADIIQAMGYDGIEAREGKNGVKTYGVLDSSSFKRTGRYRGEAGLFDEKQTIDDVVERDDNGNVIPLSERFKQESDDMRYSKGMKPQDLLADTEEYRATIAPYFDTRLNENNRDELIKMAEEAYDNVAKEIADYLGIKLTPKAENIGGFENDEGKRLRELSWTYDLKGVDSETARLFTSLMGDLAFENQEAVICLRYLSEDEGQHIAGEEGPDGGTYGKEYGFKYKDLKTVEEALKKADIANYNIDRKTNYLTVQDFGFDDDLPEKLDILLEGNNYETKEERPIYSYYLSREARQSLYEARGITEGGLQEGNQSGISGRISEANKRVTDVIEKKKSGTESPFLRRPEVKAYQQDSDGDLNLTDEDLKNYRVIDSATTEKYGKKNIDKETGILKPKAIIELDSTIGKTTHDEEIQDGEEYAGKFVEALDNGADVDDLLQRLMDHPLENGLVRAYYVSQALADRGMESEYMELAQWARDIDNLGGKLIESTKILYNLDSTFSKAVYLTQVEENLKSEYKERLKNKKGVDVEQTISEIFNEYANKIINSKTSREFRSAIGALTREVNRRMPKTIWDRIHQYRMLAMLSGTKTAVANFVSNTFSLGLYRMNSMNQALLESAMQNVEIKSFDDKKTYQIKQEDRNATLRKDSTATKRNRKLATEIWDSLGENEKTKYGIETEKIPDIIKNNLKIQNETTQSKLSKAVGGLFDTVQNVQGVLLNDAPFAKVAFVQKFDELARARGINTEKINKSSKEYARLIDDAYNYAQEVVSHNDTDISKTIANLTRRSASNVRINEDSTLVGLDKQIKRFKERANNGEPIYRFIDSAVSKLQKWFIPFYKTNASLLQKSLQYSPLEWGQVINDWGKVKAGRMEVVDMVEHMSKAVTGTELYLVGAIFGFLGLLKWEKDDEDYSGRLSIKIPGTDKGYTVDFIDPISTIFAKGVVLAQNISEQGGPFKTIEGLVRDYEDIFLSDELDMFSSMKDFFDTVGKVRKGKDDYGEYTLGDGATDIAFSVLNSYIPSIVRDVSRMIDPAKKNVYDTDNKKYLFNRLVNSTPFRTNLVDKKDATGRTINYTQPFTGNDVFDRILTQMVSRGKLVDSNGQAITTRNGSQNMQATSSDGYTQMAKDFQYKDENGDGFSDAHWIRDSVPSNIYPAGVQTELTPKEKETYGKTWTDTWTSGANYLAENDIYKGLSYENQADVVYELQGFARECIEADYCMANNLEMTEAQRTANEIRKFCTVDGKLDGKMLGLIALGTAKENKLASGGQRYVMAEQDEEGKTIRNSRQLAMRHIYEEAGIYDKIVEAVQNSDGALTYADFGLGKTVVEKYSDEKAGSDYQTIYNKTMKSSSKKSSKVSGGSAGGITKAKGGGSTKKLSMAPNPIKETKVANSYLKAYADVFKRNSSKATSSSGGTVICPKCGNRVSSGLSRCPICGTSL